MTDRPKPSSPWADRIEIGASALVAAGASIAYGITFGFTYGVNNQVDYMLHALRLLDPSVLANDWFTTHTLDYHPTFAYLGWFLLRVGGRDGWGVGIATVVAAAAGAMCVYWLARRMLPRALALPTFLLTLLAMLVTGTRELAGTYGFDPIFQPSTVASVALIASMAPFVEGRWLLSGILLAIGGLFHANYLVLGIASFGLAHALLGRDDWRRRVLRHLGPSFVVLVLLSPVILAAARAPDAARAQQILFEIRSPHHYRVRDYVGEFFPLLAWHTLGLGLAGWLFRTGRGRGRRFAALLLGLLAVVWVGSVLAGVFDVKRVTQLFVWRFAPYVDLLMQFVVAATVARCLLTPSAPLRLDRTAMGVALASAAALALLLAFRNKPALEWLEWMVVLGAAGGAVRLVLANRRIAALASRVPELARTYAPTVAGAAAALLLFVSAVRPQLDSVHARSNLMTGMRGPESELYAWIRANTPKDAQILSPPGLERFRLASERAIVADWKSASLTELVEWYRRLEDVSGRRGFRTRDEVCAGYDALDKRRLDALRDEYKLTYAVVQRGHEGSLERPVVYQNGAFAVLDLR